MNPNYVLKSPVTCTVEELAAFEAALIAAGEAASPALPERICRAEAIVFLHDSAGVITGTGALKSPKAEHCAAIFRKAGAQRPAERFTQELGWVTGPEETLPAIVAALANHETSRPLFAVTRTDETSLIGALAAAGFHAAGSPWPSPRGLYSNQLHLRDA